MSKTKGKSVPTVGVIGSGSFGTAIVKMLLENSKKVHWRNPIKFEKNDNVTVMFFSFENPFAELSNQEGHTEAIKKYYPMYAKKMEEFGQETGILLKAMEMYEASEKGLY